jgi:hypothetical protein
MTMIEEWRPVPEFEGLYEVSSLGNIRRLNEYRRYKALGLLKPNPNVGGYLTVWLSSPRFDKPQARMVHCLVALAFIGPRPFPKAEVNHVDTHKDNCRVDNLEYSTRKENSDHAKENGLYQRGVNRHNARVTEEIVRSIRSENSIGIMQKDLAVKYGISRNIVQAILCRRTWNWVT